MDKNIYEKCCQITGHKISSLSQKLLNPSTNTVVETTVLLCINCGAGEDEFSKTPSGFKKKSKEKEGE